MNCTDTQYLVLIPVSLSTYTTQNGGELCMLEIVVKTYRGEIRTPLLNVLLRLLPVESVCSRTAIHGKSSPICSPHRLNIFLELRDNEIGVVVYGFSSVVELYSFHSLVVYSSVSVVVAAGVVL